MKHCMYCDTLMAKDAVFCPKCGRKQKSIDNDFANNINTTDDKDNHHQSTNGLTTNQQILVESKVNNESKSTGIAYLLWLFFGWFGAHRFYFNKINGIIMFIIWLFGWIFIYTSLFSLGLILLFVYGLWWIMDAFWIPTAINDNKKNIKLKAIKQINPLLINKSSNHKSYKSPFNYNKINKVQNNNKQRSFSLKKWFKNSSLLTKCISIILLGIILYIAFACIMATIITISDN